MFVHIDEDDDSPPLLLLFQKCSEEVSLEQIPWFEVDTKFLFEYVMLVLLIDGILSGLLCTDLVCYHHSCPVVRVRID